MALRVIGLIPRSARTSSEASAEQTARAARRPAKALAALADRIHSAPLVAAPPAEKPERLAHARRRHSPATITSPASPTPPASPASPFATGFRQAVSAHVAQLQGAQS